MIHETAVLIGREHIRIADSARVDALCLLCAGPDGGIEIGEHAHVGAGCMLYGSRAKIVLEEYVCLAPGVILLTASDDYVGPYLMGSPTQIDPRFCNRTIGPVTMGPFSGVGARTVVMPGVEFGRFATAGAMSFVKQSVPEHTVVAGVPAKVIAHRPLSALEAAARSLKGGR